MSSNTRASEAESLAELSPHTAWATGSPVIHGRRRDCQSAADMADMSLLPAVSQDAKALPRRRRRDRRDVIASWGSARHGDTKALGLGQRVVLVVTKPTARIWPL